MVARKEGDSASVKNATSVNRTSERELVVTRTFNGPVHLVYQAWTKAELFGRWWLPKSFGLTLVSCELDVRVGGSYKLLIRPPGATEPMAFFGRYVDVVPNARISWTNEEAGGAGPVTTVTFEEKGGKTEVVVRDLYPSKEALDEAIASGSTGGYPDQFEQLEQLVGELGRG